MIPMHICLPLRLFHDTDAYLSSYPSLSWYRCISADSIVYAVLVLAPLFYTELRLIEPRLTGAHLSALAQAARYAE